MARKFRRTTSHTLIRSWAEQRGGHPAVVKTTERSGRPVLRMDFPGSTAHGNAGQETLEHISWQDFFGKFDCANLAMVYEEMTADSKASHFYKFVYRESDEYHE